MSFLKKILEKKALKKLKKYSEKTLQTPVKNIMSTEVISIQKDEEVLNAANIIVGEKVSCVAVKDDEKIIAVLTERDFLKKAPLDKNKLSKLKVKDLMSSKLVTINPKTTINEAIPILVKNNFRKLIIIENEELKGIVTQTDFVKLLNKFYKNIKYKTPDLMNVADIMSKKVITIKPTSTFSEAKKLMSEKHVGSIIIKDQEIKGIITEYDIVETIANETELCKDIKVDKIMKYPVMSIQPDVNIFDANEFMIKENIRRLPITESEELKGVITQTDLCRAMYYFLKAIIWHYKNKNLKIEPLNKQVIEKKLI